MDNKLLLIFTIERFPEQSKQELLTLHQYMVAIPTLSLASKKPLFAKYVINGKRLRHRGGSSQ